MEDAGVEELQGERSSAYSEVSQELERTAGTGLEERIQLIELGRREGAAQAERMAGELAQARAEGVERTRQASRQGQRASACGRT